MEWKDGERRGFEAHVTVPEGYSHGFDNAQRGLLYDLMRQLGAALSEFAKTGEECSIKFQPIMRDDGYFKTTRYHTRCVVTKNPNASYEVAYREERRMRDLETLRAAVIKYSQSFSSDDPNESDKALHAMLALVTPHVDPFSEETWRGSSHADACVSAAAREERMRSVLDSILRRSGIPPMY